MHRSWKLRRDSHDVSSPSSADERFCHSDERLTVFCTSKEQTPALDRSTCLIIDRQARFSAAAWPCSQTRCWKPVRVQPPMHRIVGAKEHVAVAAPAPTRSGPCQLHSYVTEQGPAIAHNTHALGGFHVAQPGSIPL